MANYKITTETGIKAITDGIKAEINEIIIKALTEKYGEENVSMGRYGGSSQTNGIVIRVGTIEDAGFEYDLCFANETTYKSYKDKVTKRYTVEGFDFDTAVQTYDDYLAEKAQKQAEAKAKKANSPKAKKDAEKAERVAESRAAAERAEKRSREKYDAMLEEARQKRIANGLEGE